MCWKNWMRVIRKPILYIELLPTCKRNGTHMSQQAVIKKWDSIAPAHSEKRSRLQVLAPVLPSKNTSGSCSSQTSDSIALTRPKKYAGRRCWHQRYLPKVFSLFLVLRYSISSHPLIPKKDTVRRCEHQGRLLRISDIIAPARPWKLQVADVKTKDIF